VGGVPREVTVLQHVDTSGYLARTVARWATTWVTVTNAPGDQHNPAQNATKALAHHHTAWRSTITQQYLVFQQLIKFVTAMLEAFM